jgi:hypothetical protein
MSRMIESVVIKANLHTGEHSSLRPAQSGVSKFANR